MKRFKYFIVTGILSICITGCLKRNFFPDPDDPGLSRFTAYGYNIATAYINGDAFINPFLGRYRGNALPSFIKMATTGTFDSLSLSWPIVLNNDGSLPYNGTYQNVSLLIPVPKGFTQTDLLSWNGKRFPANAIRIDINSINNFPGPLSGTSSIYFVQIAIDKSYTTSTVYQISGLFEGNIGDSVSITKGRFDFKIPGSSLNF